MQTRKLGSLDVSAIGLGCMGMTSAYGPPADSGQMVTLIRHAHDLGVTHFDTAEAYGPFTNESLLGEALAPIRDKVKIATKFGFAIDPAGDGRAQARHRQPARPHSRCGRGDADAPPDRPDRPSLPAPRRPRRPDRGGGRGCPRLIAEGRVLHFGLSEAGPQTIRRAHAVHPVTAVQSEFSLFWRQPMTDLFPLLDELDIGFVPFTPLGAGFLTGKIDETTTFDATDFRNMVPRLAPDARRANMELVDVVTALAATRNVAPAQIALAWILAQRPGISPIPGTTKRHRLEENLGAADVTLSHAELEGLADALARIEVQGARLPDAVLKMTGL